MLITACLPVLLELVSGDNELNRSINSLANDKIFDWFNMKELGDDKIGVTQKFRFVLRQVKYILGKGENAGFQHFLLFPQCLGLLKIWIVW